MIRPASTAPIGPDADIAISVMPATSAVLPMTPSI